MNFVAFSYDVLCMLKFHVTKCFKTNTTLNNFIRDLADENEDVPFPYWIIAAVATPFLLIVVIAIVIICVLRKKMKMERDKISDLLTSHPAALSVPSERPQTTVSTISQKFNSKEILIFLDGNSNMIDFTKEIIPQAAHIPSNPKREIPRSAFEIKGHLGSGNFGSVYKGEIKSHLKINSKIPVAIKSIKGLSGTQEIENFLYEIKIMGYINPHFNLVNMAGFCKSDLETSGDLWLLIEFCDQGDLQSYVIKNKKNILSGKANNTINSRNLVLWTYHISKGMSYLASKFIMHGDLAARNILLRKNPMDNGCSTAVIADFGLSKHLYADITYTKENRLEIPWKWTALECLHTDYYTLKSDVWSFMVLIWEMFSFGKSPYGRWSYDDVLEKLLGGYRLPCPEELKTIKTWSPEELYNKLSNTCFAAEPNDRGSFSDVVEVLENEITKEELSNYIQENHKYQSTNLESFSRLSIIN